MRILFSDAPETKERTKRTILRAQIIAKRREQNDQYQIQQKSKPRKVRRININKLCKKHVRLKKTPLNSIVNQLAYNSAAI